MNLLQKILPDQAYLATYYNDARNGITTRRIYWENGKVEAFDGHEWWEVCKLNTAQVSLVKKNILESGLLVLKDIGQAENFFDTAELIYAWSVEGKSGTFTNQLYPAVIPTIVEHLEEELFKIESLTGEEA